MLIKFVGFSLYATSLVIALHLLVLLAMVYAIATNPGSVQHTVYWDGLLRAILNVH